MRRVIDLFSLVSAVDPVAGTSTYTSDVVDMADFSEVVFVLSVGATAGTVDMEVQEGTSTSTFNTSTALVSITQLGATDDNKQVLAYVDARDLTDTYRYLRAIVTQAVGASTVSMVALGRVENRSEAGTGDLASVDEIVAA